MKSSIIILSIVVGVVQLSSPAMAFVLPPSTGGLTVVTTSSSSPASSISKSRLYMAERLTMTPDIEAAIANVRTAAAEFGTETSHFANVWIDRIIDGNRDTTSAGLLEECILDGDDTTGKCQRFELALTQLDNLLGVGAKEQY